MHAARKSRRNGLVQQRKRARHRALHQARAASNLNQPLQHQRDAQARQRVHAYHLQLHHKLVLRLRGVVVGAARAVVQHHQQRRGRAQAHVEPRAELARVAQRALHVLLRVKHQHLHGAAADEEAAGSAGPRVFAGPVHKRHNLQPRLVGQRPPRHGHAAVVRRRHARELRLKGQPARQVAQQPLHGVVRRGHAAAPAVQRHLERVPHAACAINLAHGLPERARLHQRLQVHRLEVGEALELRGRAHKVVVGQVNLLHAAKGLHNVLRDVPQVLARQIQLALVAGQVVALPIRLGSLPQLGLRASLGDFLAKPILGWWGVSATKQPLLPLPPAHLGD